MHKEKACDQHDQILEPIRNKKIYCQYNRQKYK